MYSGNQLHIATDRINRLKRTRFVVLFGAVSPNRVCQDRNSVRGNHSVYSSTSTASVAATAVAGSYWERGRGLLYYLKNPISNQFLFSTFCFLPFRLLLLRVSETQRRVVLVFVIIICLFSLEGSFFVFQFLLLLLLPLLLLSEK